LALDSNFALALAARHMLAKDARSANADLLKDRALLASETALPWERAHISALFALLEDPYSNLAAAEAYIAANPSDLLVISQLCGYLIFYGGGRKLERVLNIMESADPSLRDDWAYLARLGFAASEAGDQNRGRELVERALEQRPQAPYVIHSYAHVLHDQGKPEESLDLLGDWLVKHRQSAEGGAMYGHVQWHLALAEWQLGLTEQAWKRYERHCSPETTRCGPVLSLADCGGFLLREYLRTGSTRPVSAAVSTLSGRFNAMLSQPFIALHVAGIQASAGDLAALEKSRAAIAAKEPSDQTRLSLTLVEAVSQFASGRYADAAETLKSVSADQRIAVGGSRVERMLIDLLEATAVTLAA
jgi:tetratricopeptide (TPR) repeat protein